jgi:CO/xanthine dehydrogenase FAD-binding subunit
MFSDREHQTYNTVARQYGLKISFHNPPEKGSEYSLRYKECFMQAFDYVSAQSVEQVVSLLSLHGENARVLNGGTDLIVQLRAGARQASLLVDIKAIPEVNQLTYDPVLGLSIGAAVSCWSLCSHPAVVEYYPGLVEAVELIGGVQIQSRATVGGNLCNASPAADSIPALIVHQATCMIAGLSGLREIAVEDFCLGPGQTALQLGEFLVALRLPPPQVGFGAGYLRFTPRSEMDIAVAGAGAAVVLGAGGAVFESARIALGAVASVPLFVPEAGAALQGQLVSTAALLQAAQIAQQAARPITDLRGTSAQRKRLCLVLVRRALERAVERAKINLRKE